ncbi:MAG: tetratricopeptide repeat protein [Candidatus Cloacimonetes bacterium]|nr:tetratricopeptide repeat protein [Candidatus Cloacimonadota bacterium]
MQDEKIRELEVKLGSANTAERLKILLDISKRYEQLQKPEMAVKSYLEANQLLLDHGKEFKSENDVHTSRLNILCSLGQINVLYAAAYDRSLEYYLEALQLAEDLSNDHKSKLALEGIGYVYRKLENFEQAGEYFSRAVEKAKKIGDPQELITPLNELANVMTYRKDYDKSLQYHQEALDIARKVNYEFGISFILHDMAIVHFYQGNIEESLKIFLQTLEIEKKHNRKRELAISYVNVTSALLELGRYQEALEYQIEGLKCAREINSKDEISNSYLNLSLIYANLRKYKQALEFYRKYSDLRNEIYNVQSSKKIAELQLNYDIEKKEKEAELARQQAEIYRLRNVELARANRELKAHKDHLELINKILRHDLLNNLAVSRSALRIYQNNQEKDVLQEAEKAIRKSVDLIDRMRELESFIDTNSSLKFYELTEIFRQLRENYPELEFVMQGKGQILADEAIFSLFDNLIRNARLHGGATRLEISITNQEKFKEVRFSDNGRGMPVEIIPRIFEERFKYGKTANTGLGLFIVKKNMERYGGSISAELNPAGGITFIMLFKALH